MSDFEDSFREVSVGVARIRRLAMLALIEANRSKSLRRTSSSESLIWAAFGADDNLFERSSYLVGRNRQLAEWHMTYRYLRQVPDESLGWAGILSTYNFQWNSRADNVSGVLKEFGVPSISEDEIASLNDMLLMKQLREDKTGGQRIFDELQALEEIGATQTIERPVFDDEIAPIEETIVRLDRMRAERKRQWAIERARSLPRPELL